MDIPTNLKHKPVVVAEDYERIDGRSAYDSDAKGLSLGLAQWNDRGRVDISAKVWRYTGEKCPVNRRNCPCTGCWTWRSLPAAPNFIFRRRPTAFPRAMIRSILRSTGWVFRGTP